MITRTLGTNGVSAIGFGCMGLNHGYGDGVDDQGAIEGPQQTGARWIAWMRA